ncbi:MAG: hypothetical protein HY288_14695 [Planctomycetia bacterium]|nr:hypothetical protein [Planctomycetia bacterium]
MPEPDRTLGIYLHLSRASHLRRQPMIRDKLLVLAGVQAEEMGLEQISALCRHKILAHNSRHLVGQWPTFASALPDEQFQSYLKQLRRRYSAEKTEHMLHSLGIELGRERDAYFSDLEYAAALLDTKPEDIPGILANSPNHADKDRGAVAADRSDSTDRDRVKPSAGAGRPASRSLPNLWIVWVPFMVAVLVLIVLAIVARAALG